MEIKLGRGRFQEILRDGDIEAISAGTKTTANLRTIVERFSWSHPQAMLDVGNRYREVGYLLEALKTKKATLKHIPAELAAAISQVLAARKELFYQLPAGYFLDACSGHLDSCDGLWSAAGYKADMARAMEWRFSDAALSYIKTLPECAALWE